MIHDRVLTASRPLSNQGQKLAHTLLLAPDTTNQGVNNLSILCVNQWQLHPDENRIYRGDHYLDLQPRCMSLFQFLAERPGKVVSRQELMDTVWQGRIVGEDALNNCVKKLRRLLDDDPKNPKVIETISKKGYRLVARVDRRWLPPALVKFRKLALSSAFMVLAASFVWNHIDVTVYRFSDSDSASEREAKIREMTGSVESAPGEVRSLSLSLD